MSLSEKFERFYKRFLPSPFSIAIGLTTLAFIMALIFTKPENTGFGSYTLTLFGKWEATLWDDSRSGLYFAFQMMLMLLLGHVIALSAPVDRLINKLISPCTNTSNTALVVAISTLLVSFFNWGLGLVFGAILARKAGEKFYREKRSLNYPLIGAAAYSGLMVWHGGLSGSAPIKANESGSLHDLISGTDGLNTFNIPDSVPLNETLFSSMNITVSLLVLLILPTLLYIIGKKKTNFTNLPQPPEKLMIEKIQPIGVERLEHSRIVSLSIGLILVFYAFYKAVLLPENFSLRFLTPNFINFSLLALSLCFHTSIVQFLKAADQAITGTTGILLQFPLYFGIMGLLSGSGLIHEITSGITQISNSFSYPIITFFSAGAINVFIPSGGGQWAIQGPILISSAHQLNVPLGKAIMALAYGDQLTNMIQPFWALPLLGITGLQAKSILPYSFLVMLAGVFIFLIGLLLF